MAACSTAVLGRVCALHRCLAGAAFELVLQVAFRELAGSLDQRLQPQCSEVAVFLNWFVGEVG